MTVTEAITNAIVIGILKAIITIASILLAYVIGFIIVEQLRK